MSVKDFLSSSCETRELHRDPLLRTNYYKNNFKQVTEGLKQLAKRHNLIVKNIDNEHKEVYMIGKGYDVIVTIAQLSPIEAGIDFKINQFSIIGFGRPKKTAMKFYNDLKKILSFRGISLHP